MRESIHSELSFEGGEYTDEEIRSFVRDLESLPSGELTVSLLVGCGERAVPALREFLLSGPPRGVFQPRQRAIEGLAQLGAKEVLVEYLAQKREITDAVVRFGEEAVESTAARELARWPTDETFVFLLGFAQSRTLPGVIDALGKFRRREAAAVFLKALTDDVSRPFAEEGLRLIAEEIRRVLLAAAQRNETDDDEKPRDKQRRRSVLRILADLTLSQTEWKELHTLLHDDDAEIAILAAEIGVGSASTEERRKAARFLMRALDRAHWFLQIRIQDCLRRNYAAVRDLIEEEISIRRASRSGERTADHVVRILEKLQSSKM
jgi:hypothetical protein